jgi:hypothetical protein
VSSNQHLLVDRLGSFGGKATGRKFSEKGQIIVFDVSGKFIERLPSFLAFVVKYKVDNRNSHKHLKDGTAIDAKYIIKWSKDCKSIRPPLSAAKEIQKGKTT